jgi:hypothetical protein
MIVLDAQGVSSITSNGRVLYSKNGKPIACGEVNEGHFCLKLQPIVTESPYTPLIDRIERPSLIDRISVNFADASVNAVKLDFTDPGFYIA